MSDETTKPAAAVPAPPALYIGMRVRWLCDAHHRSWRDGEFAFHGRSDSRYEEGRVVSFDEMTVVVWPDDGCRIVFLSHDMMQAVADGEARGVENVPRRYDES